MEDTFDRADRVAFAEDVHRQLLEHSESFRDIGLVLRGVAVVDEPGSVFPVAEVYFQHMDEPYERVLSCSLEIEGRLYRSTSDFAMDIFVWSIETPLSVVRRLPRRTRID